MDYLHGYAQQEQDRLGSQARFLRPWIYPQIGTLEAKAVLEIGCGVGAQLAILQTLGARRLVGVDRSAEQLDTARKRLSGVEWVQAEGHQLPFGEGEFDEVFFFFVLEHVADPRPLLSEAARVTRRGGAITATEVNNASLQLYPPSPAVTQWWAAYNQLQSDLGGHPEVGIRLPNLAPNHLEIERYHEIGPVLDARVHGQARSEIVQFWIDLFDSARSRLEQEGRVSPALSEQAYADLRALEANLESVLFYSGRQIRWRKP
jgi:ubiquinone/menaquinone biosynthesis C-methylase UbiE